MPPSLHFSLATTADASTIADMRNAAANDLTARFGEGHWSYLCTEKSVLDGMKGNSKTFIATRGKKIVGSLRLLTKKPWSIDAGYFTKVPHCVYLISMVVHPDHQHKGIGAFMLKEVVPYASSWPAQAIRLDAYNAPAGAGDFYHKCGYKEKGCVTYRKVPLIYFELLIED